MVRLYVITEGYKDDFSTRISDAKCDNEKGDDGYFLKCKRAIYADLTLEQLAQAVDDNLENGNYHSMVGIGEWIAKHLKQAVGEEKAKEIFFNMIQDKGLLWEF